LGDLSNDQRNKSETGLLEQPPESKAEISHHYDASTDAIGFRLRDAPARRFAYGFWDRISLTCQLHAPSRALQFRSLRNFSMLEITMRKSPVATKIPHATTGLKKGSKDREEPKE